MSECDVSAGVSALLTVALEGTRDPAQLQMVEFGRGFGYKLPLSIGMQSVHSTILQQIVSARNAGRNRGRGGGRFAFLYILFVFI